MPSCSSIRACDAFYEQPSASERAFNRIFRKAVHVRRAQILDLARMHRCRSVLGLRKRAQHGLARASGD
jgi:transcriptional regulator GlxA family with amidase domain